MKPLDWFFSLTVNLNNILYLYVDGFCDFTFGSAQNDRVGSILRRVKVFGLEKTTKRKSVAMCIDFGLMQCALVLG